MTALQRFVVVLLVTVVSLMTARAAEASCGSDDDCKGDRICRDGTCQTVATPAATRCTVDVDYA